MTIQQLVLLSSLIPTYCHLVCILKLTKAVMTEQSL